MHAIWRRSTLVLCALTCASIALAAPARSDAALVPGDLIVADALALGGGALIEVDPSTGAESVLSSNEMAVNSSNPLFNYPFTLAIDAAGNILVANTGNLGGSCSGGCGGVVEVNPTTGAESVLSSNAMPINAASQYFQQPTGITIDAQGDILVSDWGDCDGCGEVIKVDPVTGKETLISSNSMPVNSTSQYFGYVQGIALDQAGDILIADPMAFGSGGGIIEVNPNTGKESELSANSMPVNATSQYFHATSQLTVAPNGDILVADWCETASCGGIVEVDPTTGKETLLSSNSLAVNAGSQFFLQPTAVAFDGSGRIIAVQEQGLGGSCSFGCGGLLYIDPTTGEETELSANSLPVNSLTQLFVEPFDVAVVPANGSAAGGQGGSSGSGGSGGDAGGSSGGSGATGGGSESSGSSTPTDPGRPGSPAAAELTPPLIAYLAETRERWSDRGAATVFSFALNEPAQVKLQFTQTRPGRVVGDTCVVSSSRDLGDAACTYAMAIGSLTLGGHAGENRFVFDGRISRTHLLHPGRYELTVTADAGAATLAAPRHLHFTIVGATVGATRDVADEAGAARF